MIEIFVRRNVFGVRMPFAIERHVNKRRIRNVLRQGDARYAVGKYPPNYPVPAIRLEDEWCADYVAVVDYQNYRCTVYWFDGYIEYTSVIH